MSLTDSNTKKNYSNKTSKNTKVAKIDKKTTLSSILGNKKSTGFIKTNNKKPFNIKKILLGKENVIPFKKNK